MLPLFLCILLFCISSAFVSCLNDEGNALLSFKQSIYSDPEGSLNNWNSSDETPCSWNGIICKEQRVVSFSLPRKNLYGFLPPSLGSLSDLRHFNLRNNKLLGPLPLELFQVQGLQSLVLYGNSLSGSLPNEIGKLSYLQILDLSQNSFNGSIPASILQCKRLRTLHLSVNNFTGPLPHGFGTKLVSLERIDLSFNSLNGSIPVDMGNSSSLQGTVDLSHNMFSGSIPAGLGNLPEKVYIDLTYNNLSGPIPQNGALVNRGPTAFIGNPGLCGSPLKNPCSGVDTAASPSTYPFWPRNYSSQSQNQDRSSPGGGKPRGLSKSSVIAIVMGDVIGICLVGLLLSYCYSRACVWCNTYGYQKGREVKKECFCFRRDGSETLSENVEQYDLVPLDSHVAFDLEELLKASAFVLGKSGIGIVYKVVLEDGLTLAVRRLGEGGSQRLKEFHTEVEAVGKLRHPNIVTLRAYYWSVDEKLLVYDYIPNGTLSTALHGKAGVASFMPLPWSTRLKIMKGVAKGLVYLHEFSPRKYVHGDLNPKNILLGQNMEPRISNFGLGRLAIIAGGSPTLQSDRLAYASDQKPQERQLKSASPPDVATIITSSSLRSYYQAPEVLKVVKPSQKWDVYSFGVILLEMITGRYPIIQVGPSEMNIVHWIQLCIDEKRPLSDVLDPSLADGPDKEEEIIGALKIAFACVHRNPERRPVMRHVSEVIERLGI
ncbi:hypothetical protein SAY87_015976 [Trapa incisa]|uniref:Protein kinase domain-containing protein n=1 Tax=Trapa incisa TaxID=236973 RepID=A0AAN7QXM9_9MYRT|nr:hypothetical protein SAY87_015976 [Trapa incisa]